MSRNCSLSEIKAEVNRLTAQIGAADDLLPTYGYSVDGAHPHIEVDSGGYHYLVVERGEEMKRVTTAELDELLYHVFEGVTFALACQYALSTVLRTRIFDGCYLNIRSNFFQCFPPSGAKSKLETMKEY